MIVSGVKAVKKKKHFKLKKGFRPKQLAPRLNCVVVRKNVTRKKVQICSTKQT